MRARAAGKKKTKRTVLKANSVTLYRVICVNIYKRILNLIALNVLRYMLLITEEFSKFDCDK